MSDIFADGPSEVDAQSLRTSTMRKPWEAPVLTTESINSNTRNGKFSVPQEDNGTFGLAS